MKPAITILLALLSLFTLPFLADHPAHTYINKDRSNLALKGYDPVAYFTDNKPVKGNPNTTATHQGAIYRFASAEHKTLFLSNPDSYIPQFGGFCAYAVSRGYTASIDPDAFQIVDGKLLLQYSKSVRATFNHDTRGNLQKANANWPAIAAKQEKK